MLHRATGAVWRRSFDVVLVATADDVLTLEGPARLLWELLDERRDVPELVAELAALHDVAPDAIRGDVEQTVHRLLAAGIITTATPSSVASPASRTRRPSSGTAIDDDPAAAIAAWSLGPHVAMPDVEVAGWSGLLTSIRRERLTGLAFGASRAGDLALDDDARAELASLHRDAMVTTVRTERLLLDTVDVLGAAGIDAVLHKGPSIAHVAYDDPAYRPFGDIDLLVRADDLDAAFAALVEAGHTRRFSEPRAGFDRRFGKGAAFVTGDGLELDVHRTFAAGPFGLTVDLDEVHRATGELALGGRTIRVLAPPQQVVAVAMHAALGTRWPRLLNLRDIAQLVHDEALDVDEVVRVAERWRVDAAVARSIGMVQRAFHLDAGTPLVAWAASHEPTRSQARSMAAYASESHRYSRQAVAALTVIPGVRAKATYLRAMLLPDRGYEADRNESLPQRWRRIARTAVRR